MSVPAASLPRLALPLLLGVALLPAACTRPGPALAAEPTPAAAGPAAGASQATPSWRLPAPERLVAFADIHGDLDALGRVLRLAGLVDAKGDWSGGRTVLVQTGDVLDRGPGEREVLEWLARLEVQARAAGGRLVALPGNHEILNVRGDYSYITEAALQAFAGAPGLDLEAPEVKARPARERTRFAALRPGGPWASWYARSPVVIVVGDTVFLHGGLMPVHLEYGVDRLNREAGAWMAGRGPFPDLLGDRGGPLWTRFYSADDAGVCLILDAVLAEIKARRLAIGHTIQKGGIRSLCGGRLWRLDTGMSAVFGGAVAAVEIRGNEVRVLGAAAPASSPPGQPTPTDR
jgi:hypothetical protein